MHCSSKVHVSTRTESVYICAGLNLSVPDWSYHFRSKSSQQDNQAFRHSLCCCNPEEILSGSSNLVFASSTSITREWLSEVTCKLWQGNLVFAILIHQQCNLFSLSWGIAAIFNLILKKVFLWTVNLTIHMRRSLQCVDIPSAFMMRITKFSID